MRRGKASDAPSVPSRQHHSSATSRHHRSDAGTDEKHYLNSEEALVRTRARRMPSVRSPQPHGKKPGHTRPTCRSPGKQDRFSRSHEISGATLQPERFVGFVPIRRFHSPAVRFRSRNGFEYDINQSWSRFPVSGGDETRRRRHVFFHWGNPVQNRHDGRFAPALPGLRVGPRTVAPGGSVSEPLFYSRFAIQTRGCHARVRPLRRGFSARRKVCREAPFFRKRERLSRLRCAGRCGI